MRGLQETRKGMEGRKGSDEGYLSLKDVCLIGFGRVVCKCDNGSGYDQEMIRVSW